MKSGKPRRKRREKGILSSSPEETQKIGMEIAGSLPVPGVVLLRGTLGAGKTTLTRGIAMGLGLDDPGMVNSPSFTLVNIYHGSCPIYHVDLYRLEGKRDLYSIGIDEFLGTEGVTIVEWSEKLSSKLAGAIEVEIEDAGGDRRMLYISSPVTARGRKRKKIYD
jgi:tRNA threonylcarbamoyladenosine biosynthesis protein TsaE